jgi:hypothetical protein
VVCREEKWGGGGGGRGCVHEFALLTGLLLPSHVLVVIPSVIPAISRVGIASPPSHPNPLFPLTWALWLFRSINYDEKDPFLCNACGFCKYARFDFMLYAKPCCAVDPIENEEDRKKVSLHQAHHCLALNFGGEMCGELSFSSQLMRLREKRQTWVCDQRCARLIAHRN